MTQSCYNCSTINSAPLAHGIILGPLYTLSLIFTTAMHVNTFIPCFIDEETLAKEDK